MSAEQPAKGLNAQLIKVWTTWGTRFLPFADVATPELPLSRLLRLSLIQVSVGISLVLLVGTLNRVMIVELGVPASVVGVMLALPLAKLAVGVKVAVRVSPVPLMALKLPLLTTTSPVLPFQTKVLPGSSLKVKVMLAVSPTFT